MCPTTVCDNKHLNFILALNNYISVVLLLARIKLNKCLFFYQCSVRRRFCPVILAYYAGIAQSVKLLATGWKVRGSNHGGGEIFRTRPDLPWLPPSLLYNGYRVSRRKAGGVWRCPSSPSSTEVKKRV
jgi:hypothetical protein